jgi:hypothetical protein
VAQDLDVPRFRIDLDIADMGDEAGALALRVDLHLGADRPTGARRLAGDCRQVQRLKLPALGPAG